MRAPRRLALVSIISSLPAPPVKALAQRPAPPARELPLDLECPAPRGAHDLPLLFPSPVAHDHHLRALVAAGLESLRLHAPRRDRRLRRSGTALAAAVRMVDRVHCHAAHGRTHAAPALAPGFADGFQIVLGVAHFTDGRAAVDVHLADLARAQPELRVRALAREHLDVSPGGARELRALARHHFHAVHDGADRDIAQRQRVAGLDWRLGARHELRADAQAFGRHHVTALAVGVEQQREVCAAVRVVFQPLDLRRDAVLVAAEIDDPQVVLVAAALMPHGDAAVVVAAAAPALLLGERPVRLALVPPGGHRFYEGAT